MTCSPERMSLRRDRCREIEELVGTYGNADYDPLISRKDYRFYYHLSSLRRALLSWYDFGSYHQNALEVLPGYGALTGLYLERFGSVDAVEPDSSMADALRTRYRVSGLNVEETPLASYGTAKRYDWIFLIDADREVVEGIAKELCARFHQESVLVTEDRIDGRFFSAEGAG